MVPLEVEDSYAARMAVRDGIPQQQAIVVFVGLCRYGGAQQNVQNVCMSIVLESDFFTIHGHRTLNLFLSRCFLLPLNAVETVNSPLDELPVTITTNGVRIADVGLWFMN